MEKQPLQTKKIPY
jgi:hypothetical protein